MIGPLDALYGLVSGVVGGAAWARWHRHDDLVPRTELELLRQALTEQHQAVLRELERIQDRLDTLMDGR